MSSELKILKGRTGYIRKIISDRKAIFWDDVYKDIIFTEDMVKCPIQDKKNYFREAFHVNREVYYDLEINKLRAKCLSIWVGKKNILTVTGSSFSTKIGSPSQTATGDLSLEEGTIYKAVITRIRPPFSCIADIEDTDIPVFIFNCSFMPTPNSPKLRREEPLICFLKRGDTVYVKVKRCGPNKEFEWTAWDAWKENIASPKEKKNVQHANKDFSLKLQDTEKKMIGKLTFVCYRTGHLTSSEFSEPIVFHRDNAFLYGIPLKSIGLNTVFTKDDELNFVLSEDLPGEASCAWMGSFGKTNESPDEVRARVNGLIQHFHRKQIRDKALMTKLYLEFGKHCDPYNGNILAKTGDASDHGIQSQHTEKLISSLDSLASIISTVNSEGNSGKVNITKKKKVNPTFKTSVKVMELTSSSVASNKRTSETGDFKYFDLETMGPTNRSESGNFNYSDLESMEPTKLNKTNSTVVGPAILGSGEIQPFTGKTFYNQEFITSFGDVHAVEHNIASVTSSLEAKEKLNTNNFMSKEKGHVQNFKLEVAETESCRSAKGNERDESYYSGNSDFNYSEFSDNVCHEKDLENTGTNVSGKDTILGQAVESEFGTGISLLNQQMIDILERSLLLVLKKEIGENASHILVPYAMSIFRKALEGYAVQELMGKTLSLLIDDQPQDQIGQSDIKPTNKRNNWKKKVQKMVNEWKEGCRIMVEDEKNKRKQTKMNFAIARAECQKNVNSSLATISENEVFRSDEYSDIENFDKDTIENVFLNGELEELKTSGQHNIVRDSNKLQKEGVFGNPTENELKDFSDRGTQTTSTGPVLHLCYLPYL